jgi:hypothetical protein
LQTFEASFAIAERLAARDPAKTQWRLDLVVSYSKFASGGGHSIEVRRERLQQGLSILEDLAARDRLPRSQDWRPWFADAIRKLEEPQEG